MDKECGRVNWTKTYTRAETAVAGADILNLFTHNSVFDGLAVAASCIELLSIRYLWLLIFSEDEWLVDWFDFGLVGRADLQAINVH